MIEKILDHYTSWILPALTVISYIYCCVFLNFIFHFKSNAFGWDSWITFNSSNFIEIFVLSLVCFIFVKNFIVKSSSKIFENSFPNKAILEFRSDAVIIIYPFFELVKLLTYKVHNERMIFTKVVISSYQGCII